MNTRQYLAVFIVAALLDLIIHFFSSRKYSALKNNSSALGFAPELNVYYRSLAKKGPFTYTSDDSISNTFNSYLVGAIIAGVLCTIVVVVADAILYAIDKRASEQ